MVSFTTTTVLLSALAGLSHAQSCVTDTTNADMAPSIFPGVIHDWSMACDSTDGAMFCGSGTEPTTVLDMFVCGDIITPTSNLVSCNIAQYINLCASSDDYTLVGSGIATGGGCEMRVCWQAPRESEISLMCSSWSALSSSEFTEFEINGDRTGLGGDWSARGEVQCTEGSAAYLTGFKIQ